MCTFSCIFISIGFASGSLNTSVTEPQSGAKQVTLTVVRSGGASGTAQVEWNATLNGRLVSGDLFQSRGNVLFLSGQRSQDLRISVLADNVPEDNEVAYCNSQLTCELVEITFKSEVIRKNYQSLHMSQRI